MNLQQTLALAIDPSLILLAQGLTPDPWQRDFLLAADRRVLLNCCRQSGKSTTTAALALHTALFSPRALVLLLSPTQRQSHELFRKVLDAYNAVGRPVPVVQDAQTMSKLETPSRQSGAFWIATTSCGSVRSVICARRPCTSMRVRCGSGRK